MRVYLVQHGESRPEEEDPQRSLTDEGVRNVQNIARFLRPLGLKLETIWHSGTEQTQKKQLLREPVGDLEDLRDLGEAIAENAGRPLIPWEEAKKDLDLD
jgi:phosphohistidine phosphatase SixA